MLIRNAQGEHFKCPQCRKMLQASQFHNIFPIATDNVPANNGELVSGNSSPVITVVLITK